jgi:hypothetical protein
MSLRRSVRHAGKIPVIYEDPAHSYPDHEPITVFEKVVAALDSEAYLACRYASVDDAITYSLFSKKSRPSYYNRLQLKRIGTGSFPTTEEGLAIARTCYGVIDHDHPTSKQWQDAANTLCENHPHLFQSTDKELLQQWVWVTESILIAYKKPYSLLGRYFLLHSLDSFVGIDKISFDYKSATGGLKATRDIPALTVLLTATSSMSSDLVEGGGHSVIESNSKQKGPVGPRLILGPIRFINHDCMPNCQVMFLNWHENDGRVDAIYTHSFYQLMVRMQSPS